MPPISNATRQAIREELRAEVEAELAEELKAKVLVELEADAAALVEAAKIEAREETALYFTNEVKDQLRTELMSQLREPAAKDYTGPRPGTWEFWAKSKHHNPKIRRTDKSFIRFKDGHCIVDNEADAALIRQELVRSGQAWETDWPVGKERPRCKTTGYSPASFEAWQAYQDWVTPQMPIGL